MAKHPDRHTFGALPEVLEDLWLITVWGYVGVRKQWNTLQGAWLIEHLENLAKCEIAKSRNISTFCNLNVSIRLKKWNFPASKLKTNKSTLAASVCLQLLLMLFVLDMIAGNALHSGMVGAAM